MNVFMHNVTNKCIISLPFLNCVVQKLDLIQTLIHERIIENNENKKRLKMRFVELGN